jgi:FemAB-related protein (PEP-CTERM system-associated)
MEVRLATHRDQTIWDAYVEQHPSGLAYHRYAWRLAVESGYGFSGYYLLAEEGGAVRGLLPFIKLSRPGGSADLVSLPYCDVGGFLADSSMVETELLAAAVSLATELECDSLDIRNADNADSHYCQPGQKVRMVLPLPNSSEELMAGLKSKLRSQVRKPIRDGLTVQLGGEELLDSFYSVFSENMRELGSPVHSRAWFFSILDAYADNVRVGLVSTPDGEPAAAGILLLNGSGVSIPWASSLRRYNRMNPNMLLYWTFLAFATDNGYQKFDFGRSTVDETTYNFKKQWGAQPVSLHWVHYDRAGHIQEELNGQPSTMRKAAEACWRRLPLPVCNWIGPHVRRYISL